MVTLRYKISCLQREKWFKRDKCVFFNVPKRLVASQKLPLIVCRKLSFTGSHAEIDEK